MYKNKFDRVNLRAALLAATALAVPLQNVLAAEGDDDKVLDEVTVTGTLIRGIAPVGAPVISLDPVEINKTGLLDTASVLRTVPQISNLGISESTTGTSANGNGTNTTAGTGVNIRGLGQQATLTLINGHRGAPGGQFGNYFEPSNVPTIALGGIEILTDGASAIYGSDAIAGVVNLILRKNFDGFEVRAAYSEADGYNADDISAIFGQTWDTGSIMLAAQRYYHSNLMASDRPDLFISDGPRVFQGNGAIPRGFTNFTANANIRTGAGTPASPFVYYAAPYGATSFAQLTPNAQNIVGAWYNTTALPEQQRDAYVLNFEQNVNDSLKVYSQGFYSKREWNMFGGVSGATTGVNSTLTVPLANPNFIAGVPGAAASQTVLLSQFGNLGPIDFDGQEISWQAVAGVTVDLWSDWQLDVSAQRTANRVARTRYNTVNTCGLTGGNAATCVTPAGEIAGAGTIGQSNPAFAFDPYGDNSAYVLGRVRASDLQQGFYDSDILSAKIDGPLFTLPGGEVRAAVGLEYRDDTQGQFNTTQSSAPTSAQTIQIRSRKGMMVKSAFAEVVVPIIGDANAFGFAKSLDLSVAGRYSDYDILADSTTDPKIGLTWVPLDGFKVAASYSTSFRVNLASTDPNNAPLLRIRNIPDYSIAGGPAAARVSSNVIQRGGGNPDLEPESSETWTLGVEWKPEALQGLDVSLTYFNVRYEGVIDTPGAAVLNSLTANSENIYGSYITRRPSSVTAGADDTAFNALVTQLQTSPLFTGAIIAPVNAIIDARSQNAGVIETDGIDFRVGYEWDTGAGRFDAALLGNYFMSYKRSLTPTGTLISRVDLIDFPQRYRLRGQFGWSLGGLSANLFANYTPEYTNTYPTPVAKVDSYLTFDMGVSYDTGDEVGIGALRNITVSLNAQNVLDKEPPYVAEFNQNFDSSITSMLQRVLTAQISKKF